MHLNRALSLSLIAGSALLSACDPISSTNGGSPIGVAVMNARTQGSGYTTSPQIAFFRVTSATFVSAIGVVDTCQAVLYSASTTQQGGATTLGGGTAIGISVSGRTDTLTRIVGGTDPTYRSSLASGLVFTPGDSVTFTIPGDRNGFPTATFTGKTAEAFTFTPMAAPVAGQPINISWTAPDDGNSAMYVQLRYTTGTATGFNRQVSCTFRDDGSGTIPAVVLADYMASTNRDAQPTLQRVRTIVASLPTPISYFNLVSEFDRPTPVSP